MACFLPVDDDNEQAYLKILMDEIFGNENFITNFVVIRAEGGGLAKQVVKGHDYLLTYAKNIENFEPLKRPKDIRGRSLKKMARNIGLKKIGLENRVWKVWNLLL